MNYLQEQELVMVEVVFEAFLKEDQVVVMEMLLAVGGGRNGGGIKPDELFETKAVVVEKKEIVY